MGIIEFFLSLPEHNMNFDVRITCSLLSYEQIKDTVFKYMKENEPLDKEKAKKVNLTIRLVKDDYMPDHNVLKCNYEAQLIENISDVPSIILFFTNTVFICEYNIKVPALPVSNDESDHRDNRGSQDYSDQDKHDYTDRK